MSRIQKGEVIREGIAHLEDLPLEKFIDTVENLKSKVATEKLDGANLWIGVDEKGFFTSREGKGKRNGRFYSVDDYPVIAAFNGFRAAHLALEQVKKTILKVLAVGDIVEIEVLFGRQPNTVTYDMDGKNYIVILRPITADSKKVDALGNRLDNTIVNVTSTVVDSPDGDQLQYNEEQLQWEFTQVRPVDNSKVNTADALKKLKELEKFLRKSNATYSDMTNKEVAEVKLGSVEKAGREKMKAERERILSVILQTYKLPIKEILLNNYVRKIKPQLQADELDPSEDTGVEGVILRDPDTGDQVKLVDRDVFTALNSFNNSIRDVASGPVVTDDQDAPLDKRGGAFGQAKIRIARLLGIRELAVSSSARKTIAKFKGATPQETAENIAKVTHIQSFPAMRQKVSAILQNTIEEVDEIVDKFKAEADTYKLKLKTGREIGLSPTVIKRTLTAFAEIKRDINLIDQAVDKSETPAELIMSLYGRTIQSLFKGSDKVKESFSLLKALSEEDVAPSGVPAGVVPQQPATTGADAIAPLPQSIGSGKNIVKRKRTFVVKKKFAKPGVNESLLQLVEFDVMNQNATDVDDTVSAQNDVEFKQLRNNASVGDNVTDADVTRYLDKAHELNDEVDTVAFGLEMDDGSIAKVYVNATQADGFEDALSQKLGETDDAEEAINDLAMTFDIVDVEWPQNFQSTGETPVGVDAETGVEGSSDPVASDANASAEVTDTNTDITPSVNPVINLGDIKQNGEEEEEEEEDYESTPEPAGETTDSGIDTTVFSDDDDEGGSPGDDDNIDVQDQPAADTTPDEVDNPDAVSSDDTTSELDDTTDDTDNDDEVVGGEVAAPSDDDTPPEEGDDDETPPPPPSGTDDEEEEDDDEENATKPKKTEESHNMTFGQQFKSKLLTEKKAPKKVEDKEEVQSAAEAATLPAEVTKLLQSFPNRGSKAMVVLLYLLGAPIEAMTLKKADLRKSVAEASDKFLKDSQFRNWVNRLTEELMKANTSPQEATLHDELGNAMQKMILEIMQKVGLPESVERLGRATLRTALRSRAKLANSNAKIRQYLKMVAEQLGIDAVTGDLKEAVKNVKYRIEIPATASKLRALSAAKKEDAIFGEEEGDDSFIQNQTVVTVDSITVKGNTIYVLPALDLDPEDVASGQPKLQKAFDRWCAQFERRKVTEAGPAMAAQAAAPAQGEETGNEWVDEIMKLAASLGIPETLLDYRRKQTELAVKQKRQQMQNYALVLRNIKKLNAIIGSNQK
jgi:hypothetical protein